MTRHISGSCSRLCRRSESGSCSRLCRGSESGNCSGLRCRGWGRLCCWRVWKSHNARATYLSSKSTFAALQLSGVEHGGVDWLRQSILAPSNWPWCRIIGVELACILVCSRYHIAAFTTRLPTIVSGTTRCLIGVAWRITVCLLYTTGSGPRLRVVSTSSNSSTPKKERDKR